MTTRRLFVALFAIALFTMAVRETLDPDMWWHLRSGEYILQAGIPRQDVFSFTVPHHEWTTHEWLSQVFMWSVYRLAGLPGLMVAFAFLVALSFWLTYTCCAGRPFLAAFVVLLAAIASAIVWGARPQIFNLLLTATFVYVVEQVKDKQLATRVLWLLPPLTILWANLHSGYLLGVVLLGTYTAGSALEQWLGPGDERTLEWAAVRQLAIVTALCLAAAALNPSGPALWIYPFLTLGSQAMQAYIQEWRSPNFHLVYFWPFAGMMALGVISWVFSPQRPTWSDMLLFMGTAAAGLLSARHIPLFTIVAAPIVCRHLLASLAQTRLQPILSNHSTPAGRLAAFNWVILLLALLMTVAWSVHKMAENETAIAARYPVTAVDFLEQEGLAALPGYNSYNWGGYLIWRGIPVFVDGRADVYGDEFLFYYLQAFEARSDWAAPLDDFNVVYVLMEPESPLATLLAASEQWREAYADDVAKIFLRRSDG